MAITERDLQGYFNVLRGLANEQAGADLPAPEREKLLPAISAGVCVLESIVVDINRIAWCLERLVDIEQNRS